MAVEEEITYQVELRSVRYWRSNIRLEALRQ